MSKLEEKVNMMLSFCRNVSKDFNIRFIQIDLDSYGRTNLADKKCK